MDFGKLAVSATKNTKTAPPREADIIEFIEASWGLGRTVELYPVQRVILKAFYGIALDETNKNIKVTDFRRDNIRMMTEAEYLEHLYKESRCNIDKVVPGRERRELVLAVGRRSGKCVDKNTLVLTNQGMKRIGEMGSIPYESHVPYICEVAQEGRETRSKSAYFYNGGAKPVITLKTQMGYNLTATHNHRIRVFDPDQLDMVWRRMDELKVKDLVGIHCGTALWADKDPDISSAKLWAPLNEKVPETLTPMWSKLAGMVTADGYIHRATVVAVIPKDRENEIRDLFSITMGDHHVWFDNVWKCAASNRAVAKLFRSMGIGSPNPTGIPQGFLNVTKETQAAFLCGLLESAYSRSDDGKLHFDFRHTQMVQEIQVLLANYGVISKTSRRKKVFLNNRISIEDPSNLVRFSDEILDHSQILRVACDGAISKAGQMPPVEMLGVRKHLPALLKESKASFRAQSLITDKINSKSPVTKDFVEELLEVFDSMGMHGDTIDKLRFIANSGYVFEPIKTLLNGVAEVYDLNVPDGESFVAGAITNHNTFISSCIAAFETYRLVTKGCPQEYYGMPAGKVIQLIAIATDKGQASNLYRDVSAHFQESIFFSPYMANNTQSYARVQTPRDIEKRGSYQNDKTASASIQMTFSPCKAKAVRGFANIVAVFDEMAHFGEAGQSSAEEIYTAAEPSLATFTRKCEVTGESIGPLESKIISISSPLGRSGKFYELYQAGFNGGILGEEMLCIQAPTWEVNPTLSREIFEAAYERDPVAFFTEYGAEFSDRTRGWINDRKDVFSCINLTLKKQTRGLPRFAYFAGFDLGLAGDGSAIAIGHIEHMGKSPKIVVDVVDQIKAGEGKYVDQDRLEFDDVADWVLDYTRRFRIVDGVFDQHTGIPFEQALMSRGVSSFRKELFRPQLTSDIFKSFKDLMYDQTIQFYNEAGADFDNLSDYLNELLTLQAIPKSKLITLVEAPRANGFHDDQSDALVRMVWLASKQLLNSRIIAGSSPNMSSLTGGRHLRYYGGGSNPMRRVAPTRKR